MKKHNNAIPGTSETLIKKSLGVNKTRSVVSKFVNPSTDSTKKYKIRFIIKGTKIKN